MREQLSFCSTTLLRRDKKQKWLCLPANKSCLVPTAAKMASAAKIGRGYSVLSDTHYGTSRYLVFHLSEGEVILEGTLVFYVPYFQRIKRKKHKRKRESIEA